MKGLVLWPCACEGLPRTNHFDVQKNVLTLREIGASIARFYNEAARPHRFPPDYCSQNIDTLQKLTMKNPGHSIQRL